MCEGDSPHPTFVSNFVMCPIVCLAQKYQTDAHDQCLGRLNPFHVAGIYFTSTA